MQSTGKLKSQKFFNFIENIKCDKKFKLQLTSISDIEELWLGCILRQKHVSQVKMIKITSHNKIYEERHKVYSLEKMRDTYKISSLRRDDKQLIISKQWKIIQVKDGKTKF